MKLKTLIKQYEGLGYKNSMDDQLFYDRKTMTFSAHMILADICEWAFKNYDVYVNTTLITIDVPYKGSFSAICTACASCGHPESIYTEYYKDPHRATISGLEKAYSLIKSIQHYRRDVKFEGQQTDIHF